MRKSLILLLLLCLNFAAFSQTQRDITGIVIDSTGVPIIAASVKIAAAEDTLFARTNIDGEFTFKGIKTSSFLITVSNLGYHTLNKKYLYNEGDSTIKLDPIILKYESKLLNEVIISGAPRVIIKEDTVEYKASDYKVRENALAEDLLKKLPGVEVDADGNVKAQGKAITKIRVNGKDYFGGDVKTATQQLPADIIDRIQIVDDYGDQANITGIRNGDPDKVLNIQIRPDKNKGYTAKGTVGGGNRERYQAALSGNAFNNTQQFSFVGNLNNTNTSVFNFNGGGGGGQRVQLGGRGGQNNSNGGDGLTALGSIGLNYRDEWGKKLSSYGSYSYSNRNNDLISNQVQQNNFQNTLIINDQNNTNNTITNNHRFNWNLEYRIDSLNYIKFSPTVSYSSSKTNSLSKYVQNSNSQLSSQGFTLNDLNSETPSIGGSALINHRFPKRGRNLSLNLSLNNSKSSQDEDELNQYTNYNSSGNTDVFLHQQQDIVNRSTNTGATLSYNEPLSRTSNLEFNYTYNNTKYKNERETLDLDAQGSPAVNTNLSNDYNYSFTTNRLGINYRVNQKKYNYSIGAGIQPSVLDGNSILNTVSTPYRNTGFNIIPVARFSYNFSKTRSFNANYFGRANEPSFTQLQPVPDISNPQFTIIGNPNLNSEFNHTFNLRYNNSDFNTGSVLFTNLSTTFSENKIVSNIVRVNDPDLGLVQETRYLNTNGYFTVSGFYNFSKPLDERKYVFSINGSANYINNISFIDNNKNTGQNLILSQGLNVQINPAKWLEINPGTNYSYNKNSNDIVTNSNSEVSTWSLNFNSKTYFLDTWLVGTEFSKVYNSGYSSALGANPFIVNTYLEKQFFKGKTGSLRLQAFDLLNENTNVSRSVTANSITDSRNNRLSRYFMLSFTMKLQKFTGVQPTQQQMPGERRGGDVIIRREGGF
ncbi:MAG: outer membrane beta-barrel protein [Daejeonella sp.]